ncbi:MAG TPA: SIMPL domain-containing protein [Thiobacillaceae bacterium]|nr:SIMPL domain-containing protein [Thiobacillaceae bacterium]
MGNNRLAAAVVMALGMVAAAWLLADGLARFKAFERSVEVKGLAEREVPADTAVWPIAFREADSNLPALYQTLQNKNAVIIDFLKARGFKDEEITVSAPSITDRLAQDYGSAELANRLRYSGNSVVTVYTRQVDAVRSAMPALVALGEKGIALNTGDYENRPRFLFTELNALKPAMIEEATRNARQAAEKFAKDSDSRLGKIKRASQGQFSIEDRDPSTAHLKKVRVVSTVDYFLAD